MSPARECEKKGQTNVSDIKNKGERQGERERQAGGAGAAPGASAGQAAAAPEEPGWAASPSDPLGAFVSRAPALALCGQSSVVSAHRAGDGDGKRRAGTRGTTLGRRGSTRGAERSPLPCARDPQSNTRVTRKAQPWMEEEGICWGHRCPCQEA